MKPRDYQQEMFDGALAAFIAGRALTPVQRRVLITAATGLGKTVIMAMLAKHFMAHGRVMLIAHRDKLLAQAAAKFSRVCDYTPAIECGKRHVHEDGVYKSKVICASVQTLSRGGADREGRIHKFNPMEFSLLLVDEAHHDVLENGSYFKIREYMEKNPNLLVVGVTATPRRSDDKVLANTYDHALPAYDILYGVKHGWLVPLAQQFVLVKSVNLDRVGQRMGDLDGKKLARQLEAHSAIIGMADECYRRTNLLGEQLRTVCFCATKAQSEGVAARLCTHRDGCAASITEDTPKDERDDIYDRFRTGALQYLCNVGVATEGFDEPAIRVVAIMRPTLSLELYTQMIGRGTRTLEELAIDRFPTVPERLAAIAASPKSQVLVIDFHGKNTRHKLITLANVLGEAYTEEERAAVLAKCRGGTDKSVTELLEETKRELDEAAAKRKEHERKLLAEQAAAADRARLAGVTVTVDADSFAADIFDQHDVRASGGSKPAYQPLSQRQYGALAGSGIGGWKDLPLEEQHLLANDVIHRHAAGLCGIKQQRMLAALGVRNTDKWSRVKAGNVIDWLKQTETVK